ncbi:MAG: DUF664 domain-containing protein [Streptosporangiaceae bacterium]
MPRSTKLAAPVLPSGWTPLGLIEHLGHAERHWFQDVATGPAAPLPWPDDPGDEDEDAPFTTSRPPEVVFAFYRDQIDRANAVLATTPLSPAPVGRQPVLNHYPHKRDFLRAGRPGRALTSAPRAPRAGPRRHARGAVTGLPATAPRGRFRSGEPSRPCPDSVLE